MSISRVEIIQDNKINGLNVMSVHNPLVYLIEVDYALDRPEYLDVELSDNEGVLAAFKAPTYSRDGTTIVFRFEAQDVFKAYMNDIEEFQSGFNGLDFCEYAQKEFTLRFYADSEEDSTTATAVHAARQFGQTPCATEIINNEDLVFYGCIGKPVYVYFWNNDENNRLSIDGVSDGEYLLDEDDVVFIDNNGITFKD